MNKFRLRDLSFRKKCIAICLLAGLIPVLILGLFSYRQMKKILVDRERTYLRDTLVQQSDMLESKLSRFVQSSHYVCWNNTLAQALQQEYRYTSQMFLFYRDTLDPLFASVKDLNPEISNIVLYTDISIFPHDDTLESLDSVAGEAWLEAARGDYLDHWTLSAEEASMSLVTQIYGLPESIHAFIKIDFDYHRTFSALRSLYEHSYGIFLTDPAEKTVYSFHTPDMEGKVLTPESLSAENAITENYVVETVPGIGDGWTIFLYRPRETVLTAVREIAALICVVILLSLLCLVLASLWLSSSIVRPLENLQADMEQMEKGVLVAHASYDSLDEIGSLTRAFNHMICKLQELIAQLLQEKELQKEYEIKALQSQINPHFLYNSLSLINSKAILSDQTEISQMAQFLSIFYRTTLNKGKSIIRIRDEIENVRSYVNIQLLMHAASFTVEYRIEENILDLTMPNLLLQPLVENAIIHGVDCIKNGRPGEIRINGSLEENTVVFLIRDNGPGIPEDKLERILIAGNEEGYAVQNVHQRVQLTYGDRYGLSYHCTGEGTTAILRLPAGAVENQERN